MSKTILAALSKFAYELDNLELPTFANKVEEVMLHLAAIEDPAMADMEMANEKARDQELQTIDMQIANIPKQEKQIQDKLKQLKDLNSFLSNRRRQVSQPSGNPNSATNSIIQNQDLLVQNPTTII